MRASSPEPDALSVSLYQLGAEMNTLNDDGIEALMQELTEGDNTILTPEQARKFVDSFRR